MNKLVRLLRYEWPLHFVLLFTNWLPDNLIFLRLRGALARHFLRSCGPNLRLGRNVTFYNPINVHIGRDVYFAYGGMVLADDIITIDDEVMLGPYCIINSGNHARKAGSYRYGKSILSPIRIGRGAWLGAHSVVTAGSRIGRGSVIAAGSLVGGKIPDSVMAIGTPARAMSAVTDSEDE